MVYADYYYYRERFGDRIPQEMFFRFAVKASALLDELTMGRISAVADDCIKLAMCEAAEIYYQEFLREGAVAENNDGYSVTYDAGSAQQRAIDAVGVYIAGTGSLYRGMK